jgi:phage shock protein A
MKAGLSHGRAEKNSAEYAELRAQYSVLKTEFERDYAQYSAMKTQYDQTLAQYSELKAQYDRIYSSSSVSSGASVGLENSMR